MNKLNIEYVPIDDVKEYRNNAKIHTPEQIEQIKKSIEDFGFNDPVAIWHETIVEGHGRILAAKELGIKEIPVIRLDHLTDEERRAYMLVHNKLTMNTDFDISMLDVELDNIMNIDMSAFGFDVEFEEESVKEEKEAKYNESISVVIDCQNEDEAEKILIT